MYVDQFTSPLAVDPCTCVSLLGMVDGTCSTVSVNSLSDYEKSICLCTPSLIALSRRFVENLKTIDILLFHLIYQRVASMTADG